MHFLPNCKLPLLCYDQSTCPVLALPYSNQTVAFFLTLTTYFYCHNLTASTRSVYRLLFCSLDMHFLREAPAMEVFPPRRLAGRLIKDFYTPLVRKYSCGVGAMRVVLGLLPGLDADGRQKMMRNDIFLLKA